VNYSDNEEKLAIHGGIKTIVSSFKPHNSIGSEEIAAVNSVLVSGVLSKFIGAWEPDFFGGPKVLELETIAAKYFKVSHAISVNSWTSGLIVAVGALGIEPGDEIIVSPWTMSATAMAILHWNAVPVFADIEKQTFCLDPDSIEKCITPRTKAIIITDIFGQSAPMDQIMKIAARYNLKTISDTAQSPGANQMGQKAGTFADIGGISLNYHKHIHTGEGGILFTNDSKLAFRMKLIRNHAESVVGGAGITDLENLIGFNFRLGEIEAAIGIEQIKKLDKIIGEKQKVGNALTRELQDLPGLTTPDIQENLENVYYVYPLVIDEEVVGVPRGILVEALRGEGIPNLAEGYQNIHLLPIFQNKIAYGSTGFPWTLLQPQDRPNYDYGICPVAEYLHSHSYIGFGICNLDLDLIDIALIGRAFKKVWGNLESLKN
jgi:perosamine synthetase